MRVTPRAVARGWPFFYNKLRGVQTWATLSFYDEYLKKQIEGSYVLDGREITVLSQYGAKSAPDHLGAFVDRNAQELVARKLLSELARDAAKDKGTGH
jgi:hypothetical protein